MHHRLHVRYEREVLLHADRVVCTSGRTVDDFVERYPDIPSSKYHVVYNGYDPDDFENVSPVVSEKFVLLHAGLLSHQRTASVFLHGVKELLERRPELGARLAVTFAGPVESENIRMVEGLGLAQHVEFLGPLPHRETIARMLGAGCLILLEAPGERGSLILPGKLFEYLVCKKPILGIVPEGEASELIRTTGSGVAVTDGDPGKVATAIESALSGELSVEASQDARAIDEFTRQRQAERFADVLRQAIAEKGTGS
jgi:glycosyltransferase involved in cell wall biosynthesis